MNVLYILGGAVLIAFGGWLAATQSKTLKARKKENPKEYYKGFGLGIICIILGLAIIISHLIT